MWQKEFLKKSDGLRESLGYQNYLRYRPLIGAMIDEMFVKSSSASRYWQEEIAGFEYLFDASPVLIDAFRQHCYHLTGIHSYAYRDHHARLKNKIAQKLSMFGKEKGAAGLCVPESAMLGGFGYEIKGQRYNADTLKYYENLIALNKYGVLDKLRQCSDRKVVLEIGGGWGGLAYQFKTLFPKITYVIVDLPFTLLFSSIYLSTVFPRAKILMYEKDTILEKMKDIAGIDFIFLPHYFFDDIKMKDIFLAMNTSSFQEMTTEQVRNYVHGLAGMGCEWIYSYNRDVSPNNDEISSVSSILGECYDLRPIEFDYHFNARHPLLSYMKRLSYQVKRKFIVSAESERLEYKHLLGTLKTAKR